MDNFNQKQTIEGYIVYNKDLQEGLCEGNEPEDFYWTNNITTYGIFNTREAAEECKARAIKSASLEVENCKKWGLSQECIEEARHILKTYEKAEILEIVETTTISLKSEVNNERTKVN